MAPRTDLFDAHRAGSAPDEGFFKGLRICM